MSKNPVGWLRSAVALLMVVALAGCGGSAPVTRVKVVQAPAPVFVENTFGLDIHNAVQNWPSVGFGYWRFWDANVDWAAVEPTPGGFDFSLMDQYVSLAQQRKVQIVYVLGNTPTWASTDPTRVGTELKSGATAPPLRMQDWQEFVDAIVTRYRGQIRAYEVWNEANLAGYWTGTLDQMVQMQQIAYTEIKRIDPAAFVLGPSVVEKNGIGFFSQFLAAGGAQYCDAIAFHLYDTASAPEDTVSFYQEVISAAQAWGKDVWDTEVGWGPWGSFDDAGAASFLARTFILQSAAGVTHIMWYAWDDRGPWVHLYLVQADLQTPTMAGVAFGQVQSWLQNASVSCTNSVGTAWQCTVVAKDGSAQRYIVWDPAGSSTFLIPAAWNVQHMRDLEGNTTLIPAGPLPIGPLPLALEP